MVEIAEINDGRVRFFLNGRDVPSTFTTKQIYQSRFVEVKTFFYHFVNCILKHFYIIENFLQGRGEQ